MSSSRYEQYKTYGPTGGAEAATVVIGVTGTAAPATADPLGPLGVPGGAGVPGVFGPPEASVWSGSAGATRADHEAGHGHGEYRSRETSYPSHEAGSGREVYSGLEAASGYEAPSGHQVHSGHQAYRGYGPSFGYERHSGHVEHRPHEPYAGVFPDPYRPDRETRAAGPVVPDPPRAPGVPGARTVPVAPDAPTEPRLPRQRPDTLVVVNPGGGPGDAGSTPGAHEAYEAAGGGSGGTGTGTGPGTGPGPGDGRAGERVTGGRAEARRAARRRRVPERTDSLRRLLPQALVVAFLAGGTSAFVANDKVIELSVDGRTRTLHTFADDVTELLADEGLKAGAHDVVAPAPGTALTSGDEVAVRYARPVHLTIDGERRRVWTTEHTVEGALGRLGVRAEGAYLSASRSRRIGPEGLALDVRTERAVTIMADGRARTIRTNAASVAEAVEEAGITLHGQDTTSVPAGSFPRDGQTVTVLRVTGTREVREEPIPFEVRRADDSSLFEGTEVVDRPGRYGARRITYDLRTVNGVRQRPRLVRSEVVRQPQGQLVRVGTKPHPPSPGGADHLNWSGLAACESGGRPGAVDPSGTYGGLYQFDTRTWHALGGSGRPQDAPAAEQTLRAKKLYARRGASAWPHCGPRLHG